MEVELPYKAEYAKTGRAGCKSCKGNIAQNSLRIAAMVQSAFHDGKQPNWFHQSCFFKKQRPTSVGDIANFENLRYEDQQSIQKAVAELSNTVPAISGKKRGKSETTASKDFGIEYAKSGKAACRGCEQKILKDQMRVRKTVFDTEVGMKYGGQPLWHHVECFAQIRGDLGWVAAGELLPGYRGLKANDKETVRKALPDLGDAAPSVKKAKMEPKDEKEEAAEKELLEKVKKQTTRMFEFRDKVKDLMRKGHMQEILEHNSQEPVVGDSEQLLNQIADLLTFGALAACPECKGRQLVFQKSGYLCNGQLTEWTKCASLIKDPKRMPCRIPAALKKEYTFLKDVGKKPEIRAVHYIPPSAGTIAKSVNVKKDDELDGPKVQRERPALYNFQFVQIGLNDKEAEIKQRMAKLGGTCGSKVTTHTMAIFANTKEVERMSRRMEKAKELGIQVLPYPDYLDAVEASGDKALTFISSMSLCDWGCDPQTRVPEEDMKSSKSKSIYTKSVPKSMILKLKDGLAVDPESGLGDRAHIYVNGKDKYNAVLGLTDIQRNKNSYYKLQLLESDSKNRFWIFRSWGRIGTTIGGNKLETFHTLLDAISSFKGVYRDQTGNDFENRDNFQKVAGRLYPIDVDYDDDKAPNSGEQGESVKSKLEPALQNLIKLIFDVDSMKRTMQEFDLDMDKMPLGKLTQKQIQSSYKVLTELYELVQNSGSNARLIDATNRFYTLIPHNFGVQSAPLIDTAEQIEKLRQMVDSLMEIECAYNLIKTEDTSRDINPLDRHYEQLKTQLEPLDKKGKEFALLQRYVENTHAETHRMYDLEIVDIFKVARQGESRRYKPFKKLHNRKLLWHGSRLTNFAGILSHGLKIAPPEAPVTGYMFGKGIYFADMVSKSANYCCTSTVNSSGLMLLSEVALGDMLNCTQAKYVTKLPKDKHSCFGHGRTMPNEAESVKREDGVEIPLGKPLTDDKLKSSLLYNEYIVYDAAQVNIQYLLRMNFKYNI